jgi:hypothetical protein
MDAEHGNGTAKSFLRHIPQEQSQDAAGFPTFTAKTAACSHLQGGS